MKLVRVMTSDGKVQPGLIDEQGGVRSIEAWCTDITSAELGSDLVARLRRCDVNSLPLMAGVDRYLSPVADPGKVICIGLNYRDHAEESGLEPPQEPLFFLKANSSIVGAYDDIVIPRDAEKVDWEVELAVVIGKPAKYVSADDAMNHVAGYTIMNDVSERDFQLARGTQWTKGKSCDSFGPLGPWLVTKDEVDCGALDVQLDVNGMTRQKSNTDQLIFSVSDLVSRLSTYFTLQPGDVIATGTPSGVGFGLKPPCYLQPGDIVTLSIEGLGSQRQKVVQ